MARFKIPNSASLHTARAFLQRNPFFVARGKRATLELDPRWMHIEPFALAMAAAWGARCKRDGKQLGIENLNLRAKYAARMKLFEHLGIDPHFEFEEHEEAGRFLPIRNVRTADEIRGVIGDVSALLHLDHDPDTLAAVQYCVSELLRNVLEHSGSPDGGFVCAHNYVAGATRRVSIAIADCGQGIASHLGKVYPEARNDDALAVSLAMLPGVTGAMPGMYGTPDNAGAGLFITRCIAKGSGGYFMLASGRAAYRLRRSRSATIVVDPLEENHDIWDIQFPWKGTVVAMEVRTERIADFQDYFGWIRQQIPKPNVQRRGIRFT